MRGDGWKGDDKTNAWLAKVGPTMVAQLWSLAYHDLPCLNIYTWLVVPMMVDHGRPIMVKYLLVPRLIKQGPFTNLMVWLVLGRKRFGARSSPIPFQRGS